MVTFYEKIPYSVAYETGQKQKRIMESFLKTPNISETWSGYDLNKIVDLLASEL
jgi:hypothetical protein